MELHISPDNVTQCIHACTLEAQRILPIIATVLFQQKAKKGGEEFITKREDKREGEIALRKNKHSGR